MEKKAVLLVNLGSPDSTAVGDVRKYLAEFLMDERVLDVPYLLRKMIVHGFILPFRPRKSAEAYQAIWWDKGSPLIVISDKVQGLLQQQLDIPVALGMRYGNPSIESAVRELLTKEIGEIILVPLYPHYAMSTYESVVEKTREVLARLNSIVRLKIVPPFFDHPGYIRALVNSARPYLTKDSDYLLFSYHGIPLRHLKKTDPTGAHCLSGPACCDTASPAHSRCYRHQVYQTTAAFVREAGISRQKYSVAFQSRLGTDKWLNPFTDAEIKRLAENGVKKLQVICPAFVSDCLETLEEIGIRGRKTFLENGGEQFRLIPCLNDHPQWIQALKNMVTETMGRPGNGGE